MKIKYDFSKIVVERARAAVNFLIEYNGLEGLDLIVDNDIWDDSTDDEISFRLPDGSESKYSINSGPYGIYLVEMDDEGMTEHLNVQHGYEGNVNMVMVKLMPLLKAEVASRTPAPAPK